MVAISLYRGNLHRVPDIPRRWPLPRPSLSVPQFRRLLRKRSLALSRLASSDQKPPPVSTKSLASQSTGIAAADGEETKLVSVKVAADARSEPPKVEVRAEAEVVKKEEVEVAKEKEVKDVAMEDADAGPAPDSGDGGGGGGDCDDLGSKLEVSNNESALTGIEEKKRELEKKLDALNEKKHNLVQMLKQILNAEEEIKRRSMQAMLRATLPLQSENAADRSSISRQAPRMTVDVNFGDVAGESDAGSNQCTPGRQLHHIHSTSPSAVSFARSPFGSLQHNSGHTPRSPATFAMSSPTRFAATGHQGHAPGLPSVSLPGSNFVASSPSPAASGGSSSVFRESRPPSST